MNGIPVFIFFLLQGQIKYFKDDNPIEGIVIVAAIAIIILFSILFHIMRNTWAASIAGKGKAAITPRKFSFFTFQRIASTYSLNREQTRLLEYVFRNDAVSNPDRVMQNPELLDRHFKRAYKSIERDSETKEDAERRLVGLFSLRNVIDAALGQGADGTEGGHPSENTPAILINGNENYPVKILFAKGHNVVTEIPKTILGSPVRFARGTRIALSFFTKNNTGFSFDGHIMGITDTDQGPGLQISHSGKIRPLAKRKHRRIAMSIPCDFFPVFLEETGVGRKKISKLVVSKKRYTGTVLDVSVGGCSIKTKAPIQSGSRLKIVMVYNNPLNVLGQILRTNRSGAAGMVLHIKFLKVPDRAFNVISALVFGYDKE